MQCNATASQRGGPKRLPVTRAFTLIEMLVVLAIAALLLSLGWGVARKMTAATGTTSAARTLATQLRLARQFAISQHTYVALLLPSATDFTGDDAAKYGNVALRACLVTKSGSSTYTFSSFPQDSKWSYLPNGLKIFADNTTIAGTGGPFPVAPNNGNTTNLFTAHSTCSVPIGTAFPANVPTVAATTVRCVVFKSTGQLDVAQSVCIPVYRAPDPGNNILQVVINWVTGRTTYYYGDGTPF